MQMQKSRSETKLNILRIAAAVLALPLVSLLVFSSAPVSAQGRTPLCDGQPATIVHIGYDSAIFGTSGDDVIVVQGGWNHIHAGNGSDTICVVGHFNVLQGDAGDDTILVDGIHNTLSGDDGDDTLQADDGNTILRCGDGNNRCNGDDC